MKTSIYFRRNWQLYALLLLPMIYFIIFKYGPMYGVQIAFKDFNFFQGIAGSEWIGLDAFREVFQNQGFYTALRNTLVLNMLDLLVSFPAPLILAILLFEPEEGLVQKVGTDFTVHSSLYFVGHYWRDRTSGIRYTIRFY